MAKKVSDEIETKKKQTIRKRDTFLIILIVISLGSIFVNLYDKKNSETINITVDPKLKEEVSKINSTEKISIFVYNQTTKMLEEKEVSVPKQSNLIEGDFINEIIKASPYISDKMKFQSAYNLEIDGTNTTIIKLNSEFSKLKKNSELFNGFSQAIGETILRNFKNVGQINIQIDGETNGQ